MTAQRSSAFASEPNFDGPLVRAMNLPDDPDVRLLFAFAHLAESVYDAEEREPDNVQVQTTLKGGIVFATIFDKRIRPDIIRYLKETNNSFHSGSLTSFLERCLL